jgi:hypothetical protein
MLWRCLARGVTADRSSCLASWRSILRHNRDIRSHVSAHEPDSSLDCLCWCGASMSPFDTEGDLEGRYVSFSPSVRSRRGSQAGCAVLRQDATVRRYAPRVIRTMRAQPSALFPGIAHAVLARRHLSPDVQQNLPLSAVAQGDTGGSWNMSCELPLLMPARGLTSSPCACRRVWTTRVDTRSGQHADVRCPRRMLTSVASSASLGSVLFKR